MTVFKTLMREFGLILLGTALVLLCAAVTLHLAGAISPVYYSYYALGCILTYALAWFALVMRRRGATAEHRAARGFAVLFACLTVLVTGPMALDRSLSVLLINEMGSDRYLRPREEWAGRAMQRFSCQFSAVDKRLAEQQAAGNVIQQERNYGLSAQGRLLNSFLHGLGWFFNVPRFTRQPEGCRTAQ